jgi:hypothetical protein
VEPTPGQFTGGATTAVALAGPDGATIFAAIGVRVVAFRDEAGGLREVGRSAVLTEVPEALTSSDELLLATGPGLAGGAGDPRAWLTVLDGRGNVPEVLATLRLPSHQAGAVALAYAHAYVITEDGLAVASLKDPRQPRLLGHIPLPPVDRLRRPWWPGGIARVGDRLVVARPGGLFTLAIGDCRKRRSGCLARTAPARSTTSSRSATSPTRSVPRASRCWTCRRRARPPG